MPKPSRPPSSPIEELAAAVANDSSSPDAPRAPRARPTPQIGERLAAGAKNAAPHLKVAANVAGEILNVLLWVGAGVAGLFIIGASYNSSIEAGNAALMAVGFAVLIFLTARANLLLADVVKELKRRP
ncbi:MAG TPA: hypothetical protein VGM05_13035 [Planctomycetaceae bacterium]|jgi:hypothetical protein